ncbi:uncharacterized protein LOC108912988 [Anoplophora glabripennis]|uniref:uncharacterized protein LOC108912988 n=1 Tax=Anoplophora glabripennis TaxID=217634 RepID=UPI000874172A|nr:uncharacterized protein LOC108912988 [Anoplophora glabripennis]XP_018573946.1 uncharacterized protein LOC108912988 [Anoplophora glabripennis]XP_018573947.1 uncharacterized protein LOC108912988 [Anoplophora glabripennis]
MDTTVKSSTVKKFYPTVEECKINNLVKCTEDGCSNVFTSESNLTLHLMKTHKKSHLLDSNLSLKQYYCPEVGCIYNKNKFFKNMKCLRQHYVKVHCTKNFQCTLCQKNFPTKNFLNNHIEYCGINFECCDCQATYSCYETLKTHGRRKKHNILFKSEYKSKLAISKSEDVIPSNKNRVILPKQCISLVVLPTINKSVTNREIQTEEEKPKLRSKMTQVNRNAVLTSQNTQQTQTEMKQNLLTVETQTMGDFVNINRKQLDALNEANDQKTSITQTDIIESRSTSCNTSFNLDDFEFSLKTETEKNSSGTQTQSNDIYSISTATHDSIHTDTSDLFAETLNANMSSFEFFNCNMETQTDFMLSDEMFNCDYYMSNMYTQTCNEILNDLGFSDIQTQTVLDDVLRSVESQTMVSRGRKNVICKDTSHMETQTDMEYLNMLEVINS